jgi:hypothetical protein
LASQIHQFRWNRNSFSAVGLLAWRIVVVRIIVNLDEHIVVIVDHHIIPAVAAFAFIAPPFLDSFASIIASARHPCRPCLCHRPCRPYLHPFRPYHRPSFIDLPCPYLDLIAVILDQLVIRHSSFKC